MTKAKIPTPKGSKPCHSCGKLVKGPRTHVCPHCNATFGFGVKKTTNSDTNKVEEVVAALTSLLEASIAIKNMTFYSERHLTDLANIARELGKSLGDSVAQKILTR